MFGCQVTLEFDSQGDANTIKVKDVSEASWNRFWLRLHAEKTEHIYGGIHHGRSSHLLTRVVSPLFSAARPLSSGFNGATILD